MDESTSREKVLKRIRNASIDKTLNPYSEVDMTSQVFNISNETVDVAFAEEFVRIGGKFIYCPSEQDFLDSFKTFVKENNIAPVFCFENQMCDKLEVAGISYSSERNDIYKAEAGLTSCEFLIARLGSIMISSAMNSGRRINVFPEKHIVYAYTDQIVPDLQQAFTGMAERYGTAIPSLISVISGPSRTADIEKTLVMGAHGPKELYLFLIEK